MLYMHVGLQKTGSTTIQKFLARNASRLPELGFEYPKAGRRGDRHHNLAHKYVRPRHFDPAIGDWPDLRAAIAEHPDQTFIISSEELDRVKPTEVAEIAAALSGIPVKVVAYVRDQATLIESMYLQYAKTGGVQTFDQYFDEHLDDERYRFHDYLQRWHAFGPDALVVRPLERSQLVNESVVEDILGVIGFPRTPDEAGLEQVKDWNVAPGARTLDLALRLSSRLESAGVKRYDVRHRVVEPVRRACGRLGWDQERPSLLSKSQVELCRERFADQNRLLSERYLGGRTAFHEQPGVREAEPAAVPDSLSVDELAALVAAAARGVLEPQKGLRKAKQAD